MNYSFRRKNRKILILSSGWLNGESFVLKRSGDQTINYSPLLSLDTETRLWNKIPDHLSVWRTSLITAGPWSLCDCRGMIITLIRCNQSSLWGEHNNDGRFGHLLDNNNIQSSSIPVGHSSHLCLYCRSRRNNILQKLTFLCHRADLSKQKISGLLSWFWQGTIHWPCFVFVICMDWI